MNSSNLFFDQKGCAITIHFLTLNTNMYTYISRYLESKFKCLFLTQHSPFIILCPGPAEPGGRHLPPPPTPAQILASQLTIFHRGGGILCPPNYYFSLPLLIFRPSAGSNVNIVFQRHLTDMFLNIQLLILFTTITVKATDLENSWPELQVLIFSSSIAQEDYFFFSICFGTLLSPKYVLTGATCIEGG